MSSSLDTVKAAYAAFGRDEFPPLSPCDTHQFPQATA